MTYREYMKLNRPEKVSTRYDGGVAGCPCMFGLGPEMAWTHTCPEHKCFECWNRECKNANKMTENKGGETMPTSAIVKNNKTKAELLDEIKDLKKEVERLDRNKQYETTALEVRALYDSFVTAGFNTAEAFELTPLMVKAQMSKV